MVPIKEAAVVGLLQWVAASRPEIKSLEMLNKTSFLDVAAQYEKSHKRPFDLHSSDDLMRKWGDAFSHLSDRGRRDHYSHFKFEWERKTGTQIDTSPRWIDEDALERYRRVPFKAMFFLTSEDRLANAYIEEHWKALDGMSGEFCDIYICDMRANNDDSAYKQMQSLTNIPGVEQLAPNDLPCLLIWSGADHARLSLRISDHDPAEMTSRLCACFGKLWEVGKVLPENVGSGSIWQKLTGKRPQEKTQSDLAKEILRHLALSFNSSDSKRTYDARKELQFDVFISYKRRLRKQVADLADTFSDAKIKVWFDKALEPGDQFHADIAHHLRNSRAVVVAWSPDAFPKGGDRNGWVVGEALIGRSRLSAGDGGFVPTLFESTDLDPPFNVDHVVDLTQWFEKSPWDRKDSAEWKSLLAALYPWIGDPRQAPSSPTANG